MYFEAIYNTVQLLIYVTLSYHSLVFKQYFLIPLVDQCFLSRKERSRPLKQNFWTAKLSEASVRGAAGCGARGLLTSKGSHLARPSVLPPFSAWSAVVEIEMLRGHG